MTSTLWLFHCFVEWSISKHWNYICGYLDAMIVTSMVFNCLMTSWIICHNYTKFHFIFKQKSPATRVTCRFLRNEAIQRSFIGRGYQQVASFVLTDTDKNTGKCKIYSLPYDFEYFLDLDNSFSGGLFRKVRFLTMRDKHPFEDPLFRVISRDMPFLEHLKISNEHAQKDKQRSSTVFEFPHLKYLDLEYAHDDYAELFLLTRNTCLPRLSTLHIGHKSIRRLTNNFNSDSTHFNFHGVRTLDFSASFICEGNFAKYFPLSTIIWRK